MSYALCMAQERQMDVDTRIFHVCTGNQPPQLPARFPGWDFPLWILAAWLTMRCMSTYNVFCPLGLRSSPSDLRPLPLLHVLRFQPLNRGFHEHVGDDMRDVLERTLLGCCTLTQGDLLQVCVGGGGAGADGSPSDERVYDLRVRTHRQTIS
jgi:hypothetical protein